VTAPSPFEGVTDGQLLEVPEAAEAAVDVTEVARPAGGVHDVERVERAAEVGEPVAGETPSVRTLLAARTEHSAPARPPRAPPPR